MIQLTGFGVLTLAGGTAMSFLELFNQAREVLDNFPAMTVRFEFNGQYIVVNDHTVESAWRKYMKCAFEKI